MKFVVLSTQRSGSTWVIDTLASHEGILAYTELFLRRGRGVPEWSRDKSHPYWNSYAESRSGVLVKLFRPVYVFGYLNSIYRAADDGKAVGFKLMYDQLLRYPEIILYLMVKRVRIIHLFRRNVVAAVISNLFRAARNTAHAREGTALPDVRMTLDVREVHAEISWFDRKVQRVKALARFLFLPCLSIAYEKLANEAAGFDELLDFLKVERVVLLSQLKKLHNRSVKHSITNIDELENELAGTRYQLMLKELY